MSNVARVVVPKIVKQLTSLNAEGRFVVDRDSLAMLAAVDGEASVTELARIHGATRTHNGLENLLEIGAVELVERNFPRMVHPGKRSSTAVTEDQVRGVGLFTAQRLRPTFIRSARMSVARVSKDLSTFERGSTFSVRLCRGIPAPETWLRWSLAAAVVVIGLAVSLGVAVNYGGVALQPGSLASIFQAVSPRGSAAPEIQVAPGSSVGECEDGTPCAVVEVLATSQPMLEPTPAAAISSSTLIDSTDQPTVQPTVLPTTASAATSATSSIATGTVSPTAVPIAATAPQVAQNPVAPAATAVTAQPIGMSRRIVLDERFGDNGRGWPNNPQSTAWLADGGYRLFARDPGRFVAIGVPSLPRLRDVTMTGSFRKVGGVPGGGYGLIVRDQGDAARDGLNQGGRYFVLEVGDRGEIGVWQRDGDQWIDRLSWTPSSIVYPGNAMNELSVKTHGDRITFLVNGNEVTTLMDETLAEGSVGIFTGGDGNQTVLERLLIEVIE